MINIDITTKNTVYNTLGPQAQWVQHRFGRREYPDLDLSSEVVKRVVSNTEDTINFISVYGDPSCHPDILSILESVPAGKLVFNTYLNIENDELIKILNEKNAYIVIPIYGINDLCSKVTLYADWQLILKNLDKLTTQVCIEFYQFNHNAYQVNQLTKICEDRKFDLKIKTNVSLHPSGLSSIVSDDGIWLYDIFNCNNSNRSVELHKTSQGYNNLIQFVKPIKGKSILNKPAFFKMAENYTYDTSLSVSVTGHVFPSFELHQLFSNALCTDWNFSFSKIKDSDGVSIKEEYKYLCSSLNNVISCMDNNLYTEEFDNILANFADSNV
jgi:hypothetical protein